MSVSMFDGFLTTAAMDEVFSDRAALRAMLRFEQALAEAQAGLGMIPAPAAEAIAIACDPARFDIAALTSDARRAGSLAIPLVKELKRLAGDAGRHAHHGSTSQDVIDTAMVLMTRDALALIDTTLTALAGHLLDLAERHADTPVLARTLMQPAQVSSFGFKAAGWAAPLVRARARLREAGQRGLQLQLGGAVGTLAAMAPHGAAVAERMAAALDLQVAPAAWHTQRDEWIRLGMEVAVLCGSLGKIATDLALMTQAEVAEVAEPRGEGRGGSTAMAHKHNPVAAMIALAAAARAPQRAAALLAVMGQEHERGLGNWQAELAEWPGLFISTHGALAALNEAFAGLQVDSARMLANIERLREAAGGDIDPVRDAAPAAALARIQLQSLRKELP